MNRFERWAVLTATVLTALTGTWYFWIKYLMRPADPWAVVNHPWQPWLLKAHILVAPLLVFAVGSIAVRHVWRHFRGGVRGGRRSGLTMALVFLPMVLTGYLIQVVTAPGWLEGMGIAHSVASALFVAGLAGHYRVVRGTTRAGEPRPSTRGEVEPRASRARGVARSSG